MPSARKEHQVRDAAREISWFAQLGSRSAELYAPAILSQCRDNDVALPLRYADMKQLFHNTIDGLERSGSIEWTTVRTTMKDVFAQAWYETLSRKGIL